jgi:glycosyltransferase involved in cell wall biosynthesis
MPKIAIIGPAWPFRGGLASYNERLAKAWQDQGADVTIHTFTRQYPSILFPGTTQFTDKPAPSDIHIERTIHGYNPFNWFSAGRIIADQKYDIVLFRYWLPALAPAFTVIASRLKKNGHTKIIALVDNLYPHEGRPFDKWLTNRFIRKPHGFLTMSQLVKDQVVVVAGNRPVVFTPHPIYDDYGSILDVDVARRQLGLPPNTKLMLFFGFIRKYKGLDLLISALADSRLQDASFKIVIAGEWYDDPKPVKELVAQLGVSDKIIWRDHFIADSEVAAYMSAADVVIQPYRNATQSGISALAHAFNKPLISTRVGGLAELIDDGQTGFLCDPNPTSIADAIVRWLSFDDFDEMDRLIAKKRESMSWNSCIQAIESVADASVVDG